MALSMAPLHAAPVLGVEVGTPFPLVARGRRPAGADRERDRQRGRGHHPRQPGQGPNGLRGLGADDVIDGGGGFTLDGLAADGTDTPYDIEPLRFGDGSVTLADGDPLFDGWACMKGNPDVLASGLEALQHFNAYGWREGRDPNAFFDTADYLAANPDVRAAGVNPLDHYRVSGWREGRDPSAYLTAHPDVQRAGVEPLGHYRARQRPGLEGRARPEREVRHHRLPRCLCRCGTGGDEPAGPLAAVRAGGRAVTFGDGVLDPFP